MITVNELTEIVSKYGDDKVYDIGIEDVFSWRGSYDEPCFKFGKNVTGKHMKEVLEWAITDKFYGWKGGEFTYEGFDGCNFESDNGNYTDGDYFTRVVHQYADSEVIQDIVSKLSCGTYGEEL